MSNVSVKGLAMMKHLMYIWKCMTNKKFI